MLMIAVLLVSCNGTKSDSESPFKMKIMFLDGSGPGMDFPQQVTTLRLKVMPYDTLNSNCSTCLPGGCVREYTAGATGTVALDDFNNDGIYEEAVFENLPFDCPFSLEVFVYQNQSWWVNYYGRVDGIQLTKGKRLFVKMTLYHKASQTLPLTGSEETAAVFGHTATRLARGLPVDERVFIAGGFSSIVPVDCSMPPVSTSSFIATSEECAIANSVAECFRCYVATATSDIFLFEQGSGTLLRPQAYDSITGMPALTATLARPRAFHTATLLADGRVVLAGGVDRAAIIFQNNDLMDESVVVDSGWELKTVVPLPGEGYLGAFNSFEIFNPELNADTLDVDRDGDFRRGGMQMLTDSEYLMESPRFLHASAYGPWQYDQDLLREMIVVQAGGLSGAPTSFSETTVDIFNGSLSSFELVARSNFSGMRAFPGAVKAGTNTWIFGGAQFPGSDSRLADNRNNAIGERWERNPTGGTWISSPLGIVDDHPEYIRLLPDVIPVSPDESKVILAGWYGARCSIEADTAKPTYVYETTDDPPVPIPTHICNSDVFEIANNYIVDLTVSPPIFNPGPHPAGMARFAMGSTIVLDCAQGARGGWILQSGGISDNKFTPAKVAESGAIELYRRADETYVYFEPMPATFTAKLASPRMWHTAVELRGGSILFTGGVTFDLANNFAAIVGALEILAFEGQCGDGYCHVDPLAPSYEDPKCCSIDGCPAP